MRGNRVKLNNTGTILFKVATRDILEDGSFTIPQGITEICDGAFWDCNRLQIIELPQGVTQIGRSVFSYCSNLQTITLPQGITSIGARTFSHCSSLHSIIINGSDEERERIKALLPAELQDKVISSKLATQAYQVFEEQLARVVSTAKFNPLYRCLSTNVSGAEVVFGVLKKDSQQEIKMEYPLLPDELLQHINGFMEHAIPAHQHAKELMHRQPLPRNEHQVLSYQRALERIADTILAMYTQQYKSDFEKHLYFLKKKGAFLAKNHQVAAAEAVETLYQQLMYRYINIITQNGLQFQNECKQAIKCARKELDQHRGWRLRLSYLLLSATGVGFPVVLADAGYHYATGKHFSFFQTNTDKQLTILEKVLPNENEFPAPGDGDYKYLRTLTL